MKEGNDLAIKERNDPEMKEWNYLAMKEENDPAMKDKMMNKKVLA